MNVVGESIDGMKGLDRKGAYSIHRDPPKFEDLTTVQDVYKRQVCSLPHSPTMSVHTGFWGA